MTTSHAEHLCHSLMVAETGATVVTILESAGYWDDPAAWRPLGDNPGNLSIVANQQSDPVASLAEKLTNAIDARLVNACLTAGVSPEDRSGPSSPRAAVARFVDRATADEEKYKGDIWNWPEKSRLAHAEKITIAVTGDYGRAPASVSVADAGEGQAPAMFPSTLCSLVRSNKDQIPFVQGRYNMGASGALRFCGQHHLQLIVSRRNPHLATPGTRADGDDDHMWGFTVVRREPPSPGHKNSVYTYLAPLGSEERPGEGGVLRFVAAELNIFPDDSQASTKVAPLPLGRSSESGTLVKLYDYLHKLPKNGVAATTRFSLLRHLEVCLLDLALPAKVYDCRGPSSHKSHPTNSMAIYGLASRLDRHRPDGDTSPMEPGFPDRQILRIEGEEVTLTVYAFALGADKSPKAKMYRSGDFGVVFSLNNQTQARRQWQFFHRGEVGLSLLSNSLLVHVDCTALGPQARDDLFMASRDRLADTGFSRNLIDEIARALRDNSKLRELKERRRRQLSAGSADAAKAAEKVIQSLYREDRDLLRFLLDGKSLPMPPPPPVPVPFVGKPHPTFFRHATNTEDRHVLREVSVGSRCTLPFLTDVVDEYFTRDLDQGVWAVHLMTEAPPGSDDDWGVIEATRMRLRNGEAQLSVKVKDPEVGESFRYRLVVGDDTLVSHFVNEFTVKFVERKASPKPRPETPRYKLPEMTPVERAEWSGMSPPFDETTAVRVYHTGSEGEGAASYDWFWNKDNAALVSQMRRAVRAGQADEAELIRETFYQALLLTGVSALRTFERMQRQRADIDVAAPHDPQPALSAEDFVAYATAALAPVAWHIINDLPRLDSVRPS